MSFIPTTKICLHCFTPYYVGDEKDCPTCKGDEKFAEGYLACWYNVLKNIRRKGYNVEILR
jgi:hypothetical protein